MIEKVLKNVVYLFYPRNICAFTEKDIYFISEEYKRLFQTINDFNSEEGKVFRKRIVAEFEHDYTLNKLNDHTLFDLGDRCMTFNVSIIEDGELYTISLFISIIVPYYVIKVQKNIIDLYFSKSEITNLEEKNIERRTINELVMDIETVIEDKFLYKKFPKEILNSVVEDISFQDTEFGCFTMFIAFFNNVIIKENEK
ncbi:hypothetical protein [Flavobacterium sp. N502540]|uniref:hypothetical protein n=1 Tax=Flavobacterium sp. N502540 TaxID=2986838 RepID=UPI002225820B|nr:hypothetical protein [Flavobacterium sp. N502540]